MDVKARIERALTQAVELGVGASNPIKWVTMVINGSLLVTRQECR